MDRIEIQNKISELIDEAVNSLNNDEMKLFVNRMEEMIKDIDYYD
jgi:hypothetical protein|nr:MAG TPA: hypothetical protein [Caudoviricetes sp.]